MSPNKPFGSKSKKRAREGIRKGTAPIITPHETAEEKVLKREQAARERMLHQEGEGPSFKEGRR